MVAGQPSPRVGRAGPQFGPALTRHGPKIWPMGQRPLGWKQILHKKLEKWKKNDKNCPKKSTYFCRQHLYLFLQHKNCINIFWYFWKNTWFFTILIILCSKISLAHGPAHGPWAKMSARMGQKISLFGPAQPGSKNSGPPPSLVLTHFLKVIKLSCVRYHLVSSRSVNEP